MRFPDWLERLQRVIDAAGQETFSWGAFNCCLFAARCCDAVVPGTYEQDLAQHFSDEASAAAYLATFESLEAAISSWLGPSVPWGLARRGDICLLDLPTGPTAAVCVGHTCVATGPRGLATLPMSKARVAWRLG